MNIGKAHRTSIRNRHEAGRCSLMAVLLLGFVWGSGDVALGDGDGYRAHEPSHNVFSGDGADGIPRQSLNAARLDDIRGRFAPIAELDSDQSLAVILWDEGRGSHTGSRAGSSQSAQQGNNQQRQSLRTTSIR